MYFINIYIHIYLKKQLKYKQKTFKLFKSIRNTVKLLNSLGIILYNFLKNYLKSLQKIKLYDSNNDKKKLDFH